MKWQSQWHEKIPSLATLNKLDEEKLALVDDFFESKSKNSNTHDND